jgi:hypothetical protein
LDVIAQGIRDLGCQLPPESGPVSLVNKSRFIKGNPMAFFMKKYKMPTIGQSYVFLNFRFAKFKFESAYAGAFYVR